MFGICVTLEIFPTERTLNDFALKMRSGDLCEREDFKSQLFMSKPKGGRFKEKVVKSSHYFSVS